MRILLWALLFALPNASAAQQYSMPKNLNNLYLLYDSIIGEPKDMLISGYSFNDNYPHNLGYRFFETDDWMEGEIIINGTKHTNLNIKYDLTTDQLVLKYILMGVPYDLVKISSKHVDQFTLGYHQFEKLNDPEIDGEGFFEIVYNTEQIKYFVKHSKTMTIQYEDKKAIRVYSLKQKHFLEANKKYYPIKNASSFTSAFPELKNEIKNYQKDNKLNPKPSNAYDILKMITYLDTVIKP